MTKVAVESAREVYVDLCKENTTKVLYVDDDAGFLAFAKQCLEEQSPFQVDTVRSSKEALKKLKHSEYDVIVSDYQMPEKNGLEFIRQLKQKGKDISFVLFTCKGREEIAVEALNSGVYRYVRKEGNAETTCAELKHAIFDAVRGKKAEKLLHDVFNEAIAKVVELNEKLQVVQSLTRHDIRNKVSALNGRIFLLKKRFSNNPEPLAHLKEMESVSQQMLRILEFERCYVQVGSEVLKNVDVERHLNEAASLFSDLKGARLINECHGLTVLADSLLRQLFYNLIDNALKYGNAHVIRVHYKDEGNQLKLVYEDDGVGISNDEKKNLFQEGYGKGTGYGLYLIKRICEAYGWIIQETGQQGKGARFTITIPKADNGENLCEIS